MKHISLRYRLLVLTVVASGIWGLAADIPFGFNAGEVIRAEEVNANFTALDDAKQERVESECAAGSAIRSISADGTVACEVDDIGTGGGSGVDAINGMTGAVTLQAGSNVTIDDSVSGQIVISATGGTTGGDTEHFGAVWTGSGDAGLTVVNTRVGSAGTRAIIGRSGAGSGIDTGPDLAGVWGDGASGAGVWGTSFSDYGVFGVSDQRAGVYGTSANDSGVRGWSVAIRGVSGESSTGTGVFGTSESGIGAWGRSTTRGVVGTLGGTSCAGTYAVGGCGADLGNGVYGNSTGGIGAWGNSSSRGVVGTIDGNPCPGDAPYGVGGCAATGWGVYGSSVSGAAAVFVQNGAECYFAGGPDWVCTSDEAKKENFGAVDTAAVLEAVATLPVTTWNMKGDPSLIPHMGPTAQDFYAAFALGDSDITINRADVAGVSLAAIQGLYDLVKEQGQQIAALQAALAQASAE